MPRLFGERIMLREYKEEDLSYLRDWVNDPEVVDLLSDIFMFPHTLNTTEEFIDDMLKGKSGAKGFIIADKDTEEYIGQIDLIEIDWKNRIALLGIIIGKKEFRGKGYGTEAIKIVQDFAFNRLNLNKIELELRDYNTQAYNCYLKCGFIEEGRRRQSMFIDGKYTDTILMGILKSEYEEMIK